MLASSAANQAGAASGALAFGGVGVLGVVAIRQLVAAGALAAVARPAWRELDRHSWLLVAALAADIGVMNLSLYSAVGRIGLGLAVTLEFLGPLGVAVSNSRRALDVAGAVLAAVGVVVLVDPGRTSDYLGVALAIAAATGWAGYILLNRALGSRLPGLQAASAASVLSAAAWIGPAAVLLYLREPRPSEIGAAALCGLLSSCVPYAADLMALRFVPASMFGTFMSVNPIWAFASGIVALHQTLAAHEAIGAALIIAANVAVTGAGRYVRRPLRVKQQR